MEIDILYFALHVYFLCFAVKNISLINLVTILLLLLYYVKKRTLIEKEVKHIKFHA
jgi:hypothetical protein